VKFMSSGVGNDGWVYIVDVVVILYLTITVLTNLQCSFSFGGCLDKYFYVYHNHFNFNFEGGS
jgi:hypothetical protein